MNAESCIMRLKMRWIRTFSIASCILFAGCFGGQGPYQDELSRVEDHLLRLELEEARSILESLKARQDLPERFYQDAIRVSLMRFEFREALGYLDGLEKLSGKKRPDVRRKIGYGWLRHFAEFTDVAIKFEGIKALGQLKDREAKSFIMQQFEFPSRTIRLAVCYAMTRLGDVDRALPYLQERAKYSALKSRALASLLLIEMSDPALMPDYRFMLKDPDNSIRALGLSILSELKDTASTDEMVRIHNSTTNPRMKLMAAHALVKIGKDSYLGTVEDALGNPALKLDAQLILYDLGRTGLKDDIFSRIENLDLESRFVFLRAMIRQGNEEQVREWLSKRVGSLSGSAFEKKMEIELFGEVATQEDLEKLRMQMANPFEEVQVVAVYAWLKASLRLFEASPSEV